MNDLFGRLWDLWERVGRERLAKLEAFIRENPDAPRWYWAQSDPRVEGTHVVYTDGFSLTLEEAQAHCAEHGGRVTVFYNPRFQ